jgi:hypothetical protein
MTSVVSTEPNLNKFIYSIDNNNFDYEEPIYSTDKYSYFILTNTNKIPYYFDVNMNNYTTEMNVFMVGGGECNGGKGGNVIYSKLFIEPIDKIKLEIGKGGYISNVVEEEIKGGLKAKVYEYDSRLLSSKSIFSNENKFLLNMREEDLKSKQINLISTKIIKDNTDLTSLIQENKNKDCIYEIEGFIISEELTKISININTENEGIVFIWEDTGIITNKNLNLYETFHKNNYLKIDKKNNTFTKVIDKNKKYYLKIILFNSPTDVTISNPISNYNYNNYEIKIVPPTSTMITNVINGNVMFSAIGGQSKTKEGIKLPPEFNDLIKRNIYNFNFGSSSSPSSGNIPIKNTGSGGINEPFISNITNKKIDLKQLSGADGIIIIKVFRKTKQIMIQTFENQDKTIVDKYNRNIRTIYKTNVIDLKDSNTIVNVISPIDNRNVYKKILQTLGLFYTQLFIIMPIYVSKLKDFERRKPNIKIKISIVNEIIEDKGKQIFVNYNENINEFTFNITDFNFFTKEVMNNTSPIYNYEYNGNNDYNSFLGISNTNMNANDYYKKFILNEINNLINPKNSILFIENVNYNFFNYLIASINYTYFYEILYDYITNPFNNKNAVVDRIQTGIKLIKELNSISLDDIQIENRDIKQLKRTKYLQEQKDLNNKHLEYIKKLTDSTNKLNFIKNNGNYTEINYTYNYVYYFLFILISVIFIVFYNNFENSLKPFVLIILLILIIVIVIFIIIKAYKDIDFYEGFTDFRMTDAGNRKAPYFYLSNDQSKHVYLSLTKNIIINVLLYGNPYKETKESTITYYQPNINLYKNLYLSKNYKYKIYNDKITKIDVNDPNETELDFLKLPEDRSSPIETTFPQFRVFNCLYNQHHICSKNPESERQLKNKTNIYDLNERIVNERKGITNDIQSLNGIEIQKEDYYFNIKEFYKYSVDYINANVLNKPFVCVTVISNTIDTVQNIEDVIHQYKTEIEILETNIRVYLLNKNSKHMISYNKEFIDERNNIYARKIELNTNKFNVYFQAINIRNLEILYDFYIHLCMFLFLALIFICLLLIHYLPDYKILVIIMTFLIGLMIFIIILYNLLRRQRIYTNKYYFKKPDTYV